MNLKSSYNDQGNGTLLVEMKIPAEELDSQFQKLVHKYSTSINIPGFRKGKVPPSIVEKKFGEELNRSTLEEIIPKAIEEVIKTHSLETIGPAELEKNHTPLKYESKQPLNLKLVFNKKPTCKINSYEELSIIKNKYKINDEDIKQNQQRILDSLGKSVEIDSQPLYDDMVYLDVKFQDENLKSLNLENHIINFKEDGKNAYPKYIAPLYSIIKKMKKGNRQTLNFTFPPDIGEAKLKGSTQPLTIGLNRVTRFQPSELNQETLNKLQVKDEKELIEKIKQDMHKYAKEQSQKESYGFSVKALKKNTEFEIPEIAISYYLQSSWNQLAEELKNRGQKNIPESPPEPWLKENYQYSKEKIEDELLITKVRENEKIEVGEEEIESKVKEMAKLSKMDLKEYRKQLITSGGFTELKKQMAHKKTLDWILSKCKISEEKEIPFKELQSRSHHH